MKLPLQTPEWMAATPHDVIWRRRASRLLRYRRVDGRDYDEEQIPLLIVPSMINRYYVVDLMPGQSLVEFLVGRGYDVYLFDWGEAAPEDRLLDFDACIEDMMGAAVRRVCRDAGVRRVNILGYCMAGTMCAIYAALHPERVAGLINLAGPIDFSEGGVLATWADRRWFNPDRIIDATGNLPGAMMQSSFNWLVPTSTLLKVRALIDRRGDRRFLRTFYAIEHWGADNVAFPGEAYRKYIRDLYQRNLFVQDAYRVRGRLAALSSICCPVLTIVADKDHIVPKACAAPLIERCSSDDATLVEIPGGHVGVVVGSGAKKYLWPALHRWLEPRSRRDGARVEGVSAGAVTPVVDKASPEQELS